MKKRLESVRCFKAFFFYVLMSGRKESKACLKIMFLLSERINRIFF